MSSTAPDHPGLRVIFGGTPEFAAHHLRALIDARCHLVGVFTQPDRPAGRGKKLTPSPVKELALAHGLPVFQPDTLKDAEAQRQLQELDADVFVVVAYGLIVPPAVLAMPRHGCINVHASLLPRWRGAAPIQRAIEAGDDETGITIMQMDSGLDTGEMLHKVACPISPDDSGGSLHNKLADLGPAALLTVLAALAKGALQGQRQDDDLATYAAKIGKQDAAIDWRDEAAVIARKVRAFNPFPVAFTSLSSGPLRIWAATAIPSSGNAEPGTVVAVAGDAVTVACGRGALRISEAQLPGKKRLSIADILRGNPRLFAVGQPLAKP